MRLCIVGLSSDRPTPHLLGCRLILQQLSRLVQLIQSRQARQHDSQLLLLQYNARLWFVMAARWIDRYNVLGMCHVECELTWETE